MDADAGESKEVSIKQVSQHSSRLCLTLCCCFSFGAGPAQAMPISFEGPRVTNVITYIGPNAQEDLELLRQSLDVR